MNAQNVEALAKVLLDVFAGSTWYNGEEFDDTDAKNFSELLDAEGVTAAGVVRKKYRAVGTITAGEPVWKGRADLLFGQESARTQRQPLGILRKNVVVNQTVWDWEIEPIKETG